MNPTVSIGISFYNNEETLHLAIRSVFAQSFADWELILIDDGSNDESLNIAKSIIDSRVKVFSDGGRKGLACRLNQITSMAKGQYLARMDADDLMHPQRIEKQVGYLLKNPDIDLIGTAAYIMDQELIIRGKRGTTFLVHSAQEMLQKRTLFVHPTVFGKVEWFRRNPYSEESRFLRSEDFELWVRSIINSDSSFGHISEALFYYRDCGNFSLEKYWGSMKGSMSVIKKYGPQNISSIGSLILRLRLIAQGAVYGLVYFFGFEKHLLYKRNHLLGVEELERAENGIHSILSCTVPGLTFDRIKAGSLAKDHTKCQ